MGSTARLGTASMESTTVSRKKEFATSSSFSRAMDYEKCPLFFKYRHLDKIPDPAPQLLDKNGQPMERPMERGSRIHTLAENYVMNPRITLPEELEKFAKEFNALQQMYQANMMTPEVQFAFNRDWKQVGYRDWDNAVYRAIIDILAQINDNRVLICDIKTGKKEGNEIKHHEQCMEYAVCVALTDPEVHIFDVEVWYIDHGEKLRNQFTRRQVLQGFQNMKDRHQDVLDARLFPAKPNKFACMFCPYKAGTVGFKKLAYPGTGHCRSNVC